MSDAKATREKCSCCGSLYRPSEMLTCPQCSRRFYSSHGAYCPMHNRISCPREECLAKAGMEEEPARAAYWCVCRGLCMKLSLNGQCVNCDRRFTRIPARLYQLVVDVDDEKSYFQRRAPILADADGPSEAIPPRERERDRDEKKMDREHERSRSPVPELDIECEKEKTSASKPEVIDPKAKEDCDS